MQVRKFAVKIIIYPQRRPELPGSSRVSITCMRDYPLFVKARTMARTSPSSRPELLAQVEVEGRPNPLRYSTNTPGTNWSTVGGVVGC